MLNQTAGLKHLNLLNFLLSHEKPISVIYYFIVTLRYSLSVFFIVIRSPTAQENQVGMRHNNTCD